MCTGYVLPERETGQEGHPSSGQKEIKVTRNHLVAWKKARFGVSEYVLE